MNKLPIEKSKGPWKKGKKQKADSIIRPKPMWVTDGGKYHNLGKSNRYFEVTSPFEVYVDSGKMNSTNYSYGSSRISTPIYEKTTANIGDIIENLHGGLFINRDGGRKLIKMKLSEFSPFERGQVQTHEFPLDKLVEVEATK